MKTNWQTKQLDDVCDFQRGLTYSKKDEYEFSDNVVLRANNIDLNTNKLNLTDLKYLNPKFVIPNEKKVKENSIIICTASGSREHLGKVAFVDSEYGYAFGGFMGQITSKDKLIDSRYLFYTLISDEYKNYIKSLSVGININNLKFDDLRGFNVSVPSITEQKRIVKKLDEVFGKVTKAKEAAEKNLQNAKELFESYLNIVFANPGKDWEEKKLGEVCGFVRGPFGGSLKKSIFKKEGYAVYEQQHAIYNQFENIRYFVDQKKFNEMKRFELKSGELIMSCSGTMGKIAIAPEGLKKGIINQALLKLSPDGRLNNEFLKYWMESGVFQNDLKIYTKGAAIKNVVSVKILKEIKILVPEMAEQKSVVKKLDVLSAETKKLEKIYEQKLADLEELKKSILSKAFHAEL